MADSQKIKIPKNKTSQEIQLVKEKLIDLLYWMFSIFIWFALAASLYRTVNLGVKPIYFFQIFMVFLFLFVFFIRKKLLYKTKTWILLLIIYLLGSTALVTYGLFSQGMLFLLLFTILTGILINNKWGIISFLVSLLTIIISAILFTQNIILADITEPNYLSTIPAWIMSIMIFSIVALVIIIVSEKIVLFLIKKIEASLTHEETLNRVNKLLSKEIESRKTTEHLLKEQYAETKNINKEYQIINKQLQEANKKLEKSNLLINEAKEKAQAADKLKSSFLSNMSHEVRTPMNAIVGFATLITNDDISSVDKQNYLSLIQSGSNRLLNTMSDIINIAKIESGQFTLYPEVINLNNFQDEILEYYTREIYIQKEDKVKIIFENEYSKNSNIIIDKDSLKQIIHKLIDNAIKFTEKGFIKVYFNLLDNNFLNIKIEDTGIGISSEYKDVVYESFRQIDTGNTRRFEGNGIGLSIAKGLIDLLNGTIEFYSIAGKGSAFNIAIPIVNQTKNSNSMSQQIKDCKGCTIMIIGKSAWDNRELNQILHEINSILIYVETGFQAIDTYKEHPEIGLVIMPTKLPNINALEAAKMLKKISQKLPILAFLLDKDTDYKQKIDNTGWDDFIEVPIKKSIIIDTMRKYLIKK